MRQLTIKVPQGNGKAALQLAADYQGENLAQWSASDQQRNWDLVQVHVSNQQVGPLLAALDDLPDAHITLLPQSVLPLAPPTSEVPAQIRDVTPRSVTEIWLNGLQSIGSWKGFLGYAVAASIVVWIGMFTDTIYLLVAAMLIAPFAGPAMNLAIATASGDGTLLWHSLLRYFSSLGLTVILTAGLSWLFQQQVATTMVDVSEISSVAVLLPLVAGAAGALNQVQAQSNSLVSGTAVGLLVAASLAPPAGLIGMAGALGRWEMSLSGVFLLLLQLFAINIGGALVFRFYGLRSSGDRYERGRPAIFYTSLAVSILLVVGLLWWQFSNEPNLQRSTLAQRATGDVQTLLAHNDQVALVEADLRFTRPSLQDQNTLLGVIYVQRRPGVTQPTEALRQAVTRAVESHLLNQGYNITPLIDVIVLEKPPGA